MPNDDLSARRDDVLVVDDDAGVRELILAYFHGLGMLAVGAGDGLGAIQALQRSRGRYGLVVTDLNLPGADGFAVLQAARQANASCYVIIVTGYASLDSAIQAVRVGAYDYLTKPFSLGQLDVVLRRISDRSELERENRQLTVQGAAPTPALALTPAAAAAAPFAPPALEPRVAAMEASLGRMEAMLLQQLRSTPGRR